MNEPLPHDSPVRLSIGCDVARFGDDCTVIAPNIDADVQELKIRNGQDLWATAEDIIFEYLSCWRSTRSTPAWSMPSLMIPVWAAA